MRSEKIHISIPEEMPELIEDLSQIKRRLHGRRVLSLAMVGLAVLRGRTLEPSESIPPAEVKPATSSATKFSARKLLTSVASLSKQQ